MKTIQYTPQTDCKTMIPRVLADYAELEKTVSGVFEAVRSWGDEAIRRYSAQYDGVVPERLMVTSEEIADAESQLSSDLKDAIRIAAANIRKFHSRTDSESVRVETMEGVVCWEKQTPIEKVGLYVPGGSAPLFSTVLMLAIPAKLAGCREIVLCTPPRKDGTVDPAIRSEERRVGKEC